MSDRKPAADRRSVRDLATAWPAELRGVVNLVVVDEVDSTQTLARRLLEHHLDDDESPEPFAIVALAQTSGRGRRGRPWASAPRLGVWGSFALPIEDASTLQSVTQRVAVSLAETVNLWADGRCRLKWPNDLISDGRKLGGILVDAISRAAGPSWAVVGIGLNHGHGEQDLPYRQATSLALLGAEPPPLGETIGALAGALWRELRGKGEWLERYRRLSAHRPGDDLECETAAGERMSGQFAGFDELGRLRLQTPGGIVTLTSGEILG